MPKSPSRKRPASLAASTGLFMASSVAAAGFEASNNLAVYWGQNSYGQGTGELSQQSLATYCANSAIDVIPLAFLVQINSGQGGQPSLNLANTGNGCEVFPGTSLLNCPQIGEDIKTCQTQYNKTILLSIGGATYTEGGFADDASAIKAADLIWSMFGPLNANAGSGPVPSSPALTSTLSTSLTDFAPLTLTPSSLTDMFSSSILSTSTSCTKGSPIDASTITDTTSTSASIASAATEAICSAISTTTTEMAGMIWTIVLPGPTPVAPGQVVAGSEATPSGPGAPGIFPAGSGVAFASTDGDAMPLTPAAAEADPTPSPDGQPLIDTISEAGSSSAVEPTTSSSSADPLTETLDSFTATVETTASSSDVESDTASSTSPTDVETEATGEPVAGEPIQAEAGDDSESAPVTDPSSAMITSAPAKAPNVVTIISSVTSVIRTSFATFTIEAVHVSESTPSPGARVEESGSTLSVPAASSASGPSVVNYDGTSGEVVRRQDPAPAAPLRPFGDAIVDGFDLDIESVVRNFKPFAKRLRELMDSSSSSTNGASAEAARKYYLTAAPQCPFPDAAVGELLSSDIAFDAVFVQFYNNYCGINSFVPGATPPSAPANNSSRAIARRFDTLKARPQNNFNFGTWDNWAKTGSANKNVKVFLGVPAGPTAAGSGYLTWSEQLKAVVDYSKTFTSFGGVMMWDASQAVANKGFLVNIKAALGGAAPAADPVADGGSVPTLTAESTTPADATSTLPTETPSAPVDGSAPANTIPTETADSITPAPTPESTSPAEVTSAEPTETPTPPGDATTPATPSADVEATPTDAVDEPEPTDGSDGTDGSDVVDGPIDEDQIVGEEDPENAVETAATDEAATTEGSETTDEIETAEEEEEEEEEETAAEPEFTEGQTGSVGASPEIGRETKQKRYEIFGRIGRRWVA